jgi:UDP-glucose 4-epimerase
MKILVTGGAGFIGSLIVDAYVRLGHSVSVVDDLSTGRRGNLNSDAEFHLLDIRDAAKINDLFAEKKFDLVSHHAAQMNVRRSVEDPMFDASVNILGALSLLEACVRAGTKRFVFASSGGVVYGEQEHFPATEEHPKRPISPYGVAKLTTEQYLYYYGTVYGLTSVSLRYANVYGPRQNPEGEAGVVAIFADKMLRGETPTINGDGRQTRDYVYVADVVRANILALDAQQTGVYNVGTGREADVNTLFHHIRQFTGAQCPEVHGQAKKGEQLRSVLDNHLIGETFGWQPSVSLEHGLEQTVAFFRTALKEDVQNRP